MKVAIDGPAGAGKSTVARMVARMAGLVYVDTGAMYRGLAFAALSRGIDPENVRYLLDILDRGHIEFSRNGDEFRVMLDGADVTDKLRSSEVDRAVSAVARHREVRRFMVGAQRRIAGKFDVVMEGRDITSVVLPDADVKVYLTAEFRERVRRRWLEMVRKGEDVSWEELKSAMARRDRADETRQEGPLTVASGTVVLDSTGKTASEVALEVVEMCRLAEGARHAGQR